MKRGKAKRRECCVCKKRSPVDSMHKTKYSKRVSCKTVDCMTTFGILLRDLDAKKRQRIALKKKNARTRELKKKTETRSDIYARLAKLVQQYCKHVVYKGEPCYTCDKPQKPGIDQGGAFHSGHFMPAKTVDPRRFLHDNIRIQCFACNKHRSGNQAEYRKRMEVEKGAEFVEWLECEANHKPLREVFPDRDDIRIKIKEYRAMLRDNGINPCT